MRRTEAALLLVFIAILIAAALAGIQRAPRSDLRDARPSTLLHGPQGASALAAALERMGVEVEPLRRPLFGLDTARIEADALVLLLDLSRYPTEPEQRAIALHLARGGRVFSVGRNAWERCAGYTIVRLGRAAADSLDPVLPPGVDSIPDLSAVLSRPGRDTADEASDEDSGDEPPDHCPRLAVSRADTLLAARDGRPLVMTLMLESGGRATLVAERAWFTNRALRDTDAGVLALAWLTEPRPDRVIVDEYHHGFGRGGSILSATWEWVRASPAGWALLQVCAAALLALAVAAVRFGPAVHVVQRTRRSAIEHLEALAMGLERADAARTSVALIVRGLRRRTLGRAGRAPPADTDLPIEWLDRLARAAPTGEARRHADELGRLARAAAPDDETVLDVATTAEELWEALGERKPHV